MKLLTMLAASAVLAASGASRAADVSPADSAQAAMLNHVAAAANAYAAKIGMSDYVSYCYTKMNLSEEHVHDGSIPFGIGYNGISANDLAVTIRTREAYEKAYLTLCLADAKNTLARAAAK